MLNKTGVASSTKLRQTASTDWSTWAENITVTTQQQLFRDPAVVAKCFTSIESVGTGRDTVWDLQLATGFGHTYRFAVDNTGRIKHMWNTTAGAREELQPLRQFLRDSPAPGSVLAVPPPRHP